MILKSIDIESLFIQNYEWQIMGINLMFNGDSNNFTIVPENFDGSFLDIKIEHLGTSIKNTRGNIDKNRKVDEYYVEIIFVEGDRKFKSNWFSVFSYYIIYPNFRNIS
jgi:hypothetical protein